MAKRERPCIKNTCYVKSLTINDDNSTEHQPNNERIKHTQTQTIWLYIYNPYIKDLCIKHVQHVHILV